MGESTTLLRERVKVLIVDDNDDQRDLLRRHFEIAGCDVTVAESAETAIVAYEGAELDLAVIDLMLPGMDGWALNERIYADHPGCPVAISSVLDLADYPTSRAALPKPVTRASVRDLLLDCVPGWVAP
jgi:CheY-like chemotaxis protein